MDRQEIQSCKIPHSLHKKKNHNYVCISYFEFISDITPPRYTIFSANSWWASIHRLFHTSECDFSNCGSLTFHHLRLRCYFLWSQKSLETIQLTVEDPEENQTGNCFAQRIHRAVHGKSIDLRVQRVDSMRCLLQEELFEYEADISEMTKTIIMIIHSFLGLSETAPGKIHIAVSRSIYK